jgi:hypothetical protein
MFRRSNRNERIINLIDEYGDQTSAVQGGRMETTSHESVLAALENCANRFTRWGKLRGVDDNLVTWALDETGSIDTSLFCKNHENKKRLALIKQQEGNRVMGLGVPEEVLQIHGVAPASEPEGVIWLIYENANEISNKLCNNQKWRRQKKSMTN